MGASSSSGPFCGANDNVAADRPLDFTVGTEFTAESCRDGRDVVYYWRASGLNLRFKTEVRLDVDRFPVNAGRPLQPVFYNLTRGNGPELFGVFAGECRATNNPSESCIGYINQAMPDLFLEVRPRPLDGGEPYLATGRSTVAITALPCAPAPANTSPDAAIPFGFFGGAEGALCATATTYHWRHACNQPSCAYNGRFEDDPARVSPFVVEVTQPGGRVSCPVRDGGVFDCEALAFGDGGANLVLVRVDLDAGVAPILSEYVSLGVRGIVPPDAGTPDAN